MFCFFHLLTIASQLAFEPVDTLLDQCIKQNCSILRHVIGHEVKFQAYDILHLHPIGVNCKRILVYVAQELASIGADTVSALLP